MKRNFWCVLVLALAGCSRPAPSALDELDRESESLVSTALPSVASIEVVRGNAVIQADAVVSSYGAAVVIREDGTLLTNAHVVENSNKIYARLADGRRLPATVVSSDRDVDLAILHIGAHGLRPMPWGDSDRVVAGETVFAFGSPFSLTGSVSRGVVSARRRLPQMGAYPDVIQTDAAINPGNSGGPLLNGHGEMIGINTGMGGDHAGVGFAIPSNTAHASSDLLLKGTLVRPYLGVMAAVRVDAPAWKLLGFHVPPAGALVAGVYQDSPAAAAQIHLGDLITAVNGQPVRETTDLVSAISALRPGDAAHIHFIRAEHEADAVAQLSPHATYMAPLDIDPNSGAAIWSGGRPLDGTELREARAGDFNRMGIPGLAQPGIVLVATGTDTLAEQAGLRAEDILVRVIDSQGARNADPGTLAWLAHHPSADGVVVEVYRGKSGMFIYLPER